MTGQTLRRRTLIAAAGAFAASRALAQAQGNPRVVMVTGQGPITLELAADRAPITSANFLNYADHHRFDGSTIYRAARTPHDETHGTIEGGLQMDPAKILPPIAHESTTQTGLKHVDGTISMGRYAPGTATGDFFICSGPAPYLDARPGAPGDNAGYAAFGHVVEGMDVVRAILALPTNGVSRSPAMQGQMLSPPVPIISVKRV